MVCNWPRIFNYFSFDFPLINIDINSILNSYFSTSELFENGEVRWEKLDKVFDTINDCEVNIEHEEIYRLAINYIHNQYNFWRKPDLGDKASAV